MTNQLFINDTDAWTAWRVSMGEGFVSAILAPAPLKDLQSDDCRDEDGVRVIVPDTPRLDQRELTLPFTITGESPADVATSQALLMAELQKGRVDIRVPDLGAQTYHLIYTGKSISYSISLSRTAAKLQAKFIEPDPTNR